ncbi:MAG: bifunctional oligoribonuclease/PAP phosphatase NrnA [Candidatus Gastranaerophilales bacterium]|nr:bifunctional oligoribonuclease/PAP phosphatase NrnA [Candidatus Gastranaerophilales bacterium]
MNILQECTGAKRIGISGHIRPDGDCVGSCLALWQYLSKCLPDAKVKVFLDPPPEIFKEIKGFDEIDSTFAKEDRFDVFFALDTVPDRMGDAERYYKKAVKTVNIDHHVSNRGCGDVNVVEPQIGSTCEVLFDLMDRSRIDKDIAMALYIGIIHDTGVFQYSCTTPQTLEKASFLISFGFDFPRIIEETFYQKTYLQSQIMGRALMESIRFLNGRCIVSVVSRKVMEFYGVEPNDFDGIVNQLRNIKGIDCAIFMYQTGHLEYKVSLRSTEKVDVAKVASYFGGGGHVRAAGCIMKGNFHDCVNNLSLHIEEQLL